MVIIIFGLPGSGKSYFAGRLAKILNARYMNSDEIRLKLIAERSYTYAEKMLVYDEMLNGMKDAINDKDDIVLDATFYKNEIRSTFEKEASAVGQNIIYIEVKAADEIIKERLKTPRKYSEADFDVYLKLKAAAEPLTEDHLIIHSSDSDIGPRLEEAITYISSKK